MEKRRFKFTEEQIKEIYGFEVVNLDRFGLGFYHYYPLRRVEEMLNEKKLAFVYPSLWNDPFEKVFLMTDFSKLSGYRQNKIYCLCARSSTENEEASWKVYSNGDDTLVRVSFDMLNLFQCLKTFAEDKKCKMYYAQIDYMLSQDKVTEITNGTGWLNEYLTNFNEMQYIRLMSLKRPAFKYEEEYRLFMVPQEGSPLNDVDEDVIKVPIDTSVFSSFTISPLEYISDKEKKNLSSCIKKSLYEQKVQIIKEFIRSKVPNADVDNSTLYENISRIGTISKKPK